VAEGAQLIRAPEVRMCGGWHGAICAALVLAGSTAASGVEPANPPTLTIEAPSREAQAALVVGQVLTVSLRSMPSDEFGWSLRRSPGPAVEWVEGRNLRGNDVAPQVFKAIGGEYVMRFRARTPGTAVVLLDYQRAFQLPSPPLRSVKLTITVTAADDPAD
jgi:predicted secreted protein